MPDADWQTIVAVICALAAFGWLVRRFMRGTRAPAGDCQTGCGHCGAPSPKAAAGNGGFLPSSALGPLDNPPRHQ